MFYGDDVTIDTAGWLQFADHVIHKEPKLVYLNAARDYFLNPTDAGNPLLYAFYERNYREEDEKIFKTYDLHYNLKLIRPGTINHEYFKCIPHFHIQDSVTNETYPEIHHILEGEGVFMIHKNKEDPVKSVHAVPFVPGDNIYIKNGYGHSIINTGDQQVLISSLIKKDAEQHLQTLPMDQDNLYHIMEESKGQSEYVPGENLKSSGVLDITPPPMLDNPFPIEEGGLYASFINNPLAFSLLWR